MVTVTKIGEEYNSRILEISGLSTDEKPSDRIDGIAIMNGSTFKEIDTGSEYTYNESASTWHLKSTSNSGGGGANDNAPHIGDNGNWYIGTQDTGVSAKGASSWNDLTDKPFETIITRKNDVFDKKDIAPVADNDWFSSLDESCRGSLEVGKDYVVVWDGVEYVCTARRPTDFYYSGVALGSYDATDGFKPIQGAKYPFCARYHLESIAYGVDIDMIDFHYFDNNTHTVEIYEAEVQYNVLPEEYIPDTIARTADFADVVTAPAAAVGQTIVVKAVDETGMPTEWEAVDHFGGSWNDLADKPFEKNIVAQWEASEPHVGDETLQFNAPAGRPAPYLGIRVADAPSRDVDLEGMTINGNTLTKSYGKAGTYQSYRANIGMELDVMVCYESGNHGSFTADAGLYVMFCDDSYGYKIDNFINGGYIGADKKLDDGVIPDTIARVSDIPEGFSGSWNDLSDKPFGEEETLKVLLAETSVKISRVYDDQYAGYVHTDTYEAFVIGNTYTVTVDGEKYELEAQEDHLSRGRLYLPSEVGYASIFGEDDGSYCIDGNKGGTVMLSISTVGKTLKPVDSDYLPKAAAVADAAGDTPTAAEFNALLDALRNAGYLAT